MPRIIGYARVSTGSQTLDGQVEALTAAGAQVIFKETASGAKMERKELEKAIAALEAGDTLVVTRLDRLARSTLHLLSTLDVVVKKGVAFRSLADAWADTTTSHGGLMVTVLGGLAEFERELIKARTGEGRRRALADGKRFGRKPKLSVYQEAEITRRRAEGATLRALAQSYGVSHPAIMRALARAC
jgi:DNA invertase Pin-like site-specific DNA recombinase